MEEGDKIRVRIVTPEEAEENKRKQRILKKYGYHVVKVDGSWGPWQQEQWEKIQPQLAKDRITRKAKKFECWLGFIFLIPPILGVLSFLLSLLDNNSDFAYMRGLSGAWDYHENSPSPAPIFLGLMAIAGAYLIKDSIIAFFEKDE